MSLRRIVAALALVAAAAACSSDDGDGPSAAETTSTGPTTVSTTTTTRPLVWTASPSRETAVAGRYRQGLARHGDTWLFTTNNGIYRTGPGFVETQAVIPAIPENLALEGYNHIGDGDVVGDVLWVPLERDDKDSGEQRTARYDADALTYIDSFPVAQHHNAFVAIDEDGVVWSADEFSDDTLLRYRVEGTTVTPLEPLVMDRVVERIQGADVADGALWLATDDDENGIYRVDVETGEVMFLASMGHTPEGEGEGIDATDLPSGLLHALVADEQIIPMYLVDFRVSSEPG
jgi:hypothetical protein